MFALIRRLAPALRPRALHPHLPRAGVTTKPARTPVGTAETVIGLSILTFVMLTPAAWFLANIENFKKRA